MRRSMSLIVALLACFGLLITVGCLSDLGSGDIVPNPEEATPAVVEQEETDFFPDNGWSLDENVNGKLRAYITIAWPFGRWERPQDWTGWRGHRTRGLKTQTGCGYKYTHSGADYYARDLTRPGCSGVKIYAGFGGTVVFAGNDGGYGKTVVLYDASRHVALRYSHLKSIAVSKGQWAGAGRYIGRVGNTGRSTGSHLHLAAYENINHFYPDGYPVIPTLCDSNYYTCATYFYSW